MPKIIIQNAKFITGLNRKEDMQAVSFLYPARKKILLNRLYGKSISTMMQLLCDKLIAEGTSQQLSIEFGEPKLKLRQPKTRTGNLSIQEIIEIKNLLKDNNFTKHQIAIQFGVDTHTITNILKNKCKKYLEADEILNSQS